MGIGLGLLAGGTALNFLNQGEADDEREELTREQQARQREITRQIIANTLSGSTEIYGDGRRERYQGNVDRLEGEIGKIIDANQDQSFYADNPYETEAARRVAERLSEAINYRKLLAAFAAPASAGIDDAIALSDLTTTNQGFARQGQREYDQFVEDYNDISADPGISAISSIMTGAGLGQMSLPFLPGSTVTRPGGNLPPPWLRR